MSAGQAPGGRSWAIAGAALAVLVALLLRAPIADIPFERDEGTYAYHALRWLEGEVPYRDTFDQKPPGIFAAYALVQSTLGDSPRALHWGLQLWLCAAQLTLFALARAWFGTGVATATALLFALVTSSPGLLGNAANVESFALLPLVAGMALARRGAVRASGPSAALAGLAAAAALLLKPVTLPLALLSLALLCFGARASWRLRLRLAGWFAVGASLGMLPLAVVLWPTGAFEAFYDGTVRFNLGYGAGVSLRDYPAYLLFGIAASFATLGPLYLAVALGPLTGWIGPRVPAPRRWLWAWLGAALLAAAAGGYFRQHYFMYAAPALSLLAAVGCADLLVALRLSALHAQLGATLAALGMLGWGVAAAPWYYLPGAPPDAKSRALYGANPFADAPALAAFLAERSGDADRLFVFGSEPELHVYARRRNAGRYLLAYHYLMDAPDSARLRQREVLDALRAQPPRLVVLVLQPYSLLESPDTPRDLQYGLATLLRERYRPVAVLEPRSDGPGTLDSSEATLAGWRDARALERGERTGQLVVYERIAR